ncbi:T9SS type A sorting domain-containing protein [Spirosoma sp. SC4-14]|uniref:T9SS type A sorting domain-containing protein n=1 Tax=Spirosoma sp. SC4-14 TaxID=3128900 RepID=UPI0030D554A6
MKKVLFLMLGLVAGTASFATSTPEKNTVSQNRVVMTADHKIKLFVQPTQSKGELAIVDTKGQKLFNETVALQKGLHQQFDFSGLSTGTYQLKLTTGNQTITKTFVVQADPNASFIMQEAE